MRENAPNCLKGGTPIVTERGAVPIEQVQVGERVFTHRRRWQPVVRAWATPFSGEMVECYLPGRALPLTLTPNHRVGTWRGWLSADALRTGDDVDAVLVNLTGGGPPSSQPQALLALSRLENDAVWVLVKMPGGDAYAGEVSAAQAPGCLGAVNAPYFATARIDGDSLHLRGVTCYSPSSHAANVDGYTTTATAPVVPLLTAQADCVLVRASWPSPAALMAGAFSIQALPATTKPDGAVVLGDLHVTASNLPPVATTYPARLQNVQRRPFAGYVYNLSVDQDESYLAANVVCSNCGCTMVVVPDGMGFNAKGQLVEQGDGQS